MAWTASEAGERISSPTMSKSSSIPASSEPKKGQAVIGCNLWRPVGARMVELSVESKGTLQAQVDPMSAAATIALRQAALARSVKHPACVPKKPLRRMGDCGAAQGCSSLVPERPRAHHQPVERGDKHQKLAPHHLFPPVQRRTDHLTGKGIAFLAGGPTEQKTADGEGGCPIGFDTKRVDPLATDLYGLVDGGGAEEHAPLRRRVGHALQPKDRASAQVAAQIIALR